MRCLVAGLVLLASCSKAPAETPAADEKGRAPRLQPLWIAEGFSAPEGVTAWRLIPAS